MTNDELNKLKELAERATPGPWRCDWGNWDIESRNEKSYELERLAKEGLGEK